jgi:hypothetical protein
MTTRFRSLSPALKLIVGAIVVFLVTTAVLVLVLLASHSGGSSGAGYPVAR